MTRIERLEFYRDVLGKAADKSPEHLRLMRRKLALTDLFFLLVLVLRRKDANRGFVYDRCLEIQAAPNGRLDLWAREHFKSTIITFALTIQDILRNPEITIGIFSHTRPTAKKFLAQIKREFETNPLLFELFPEVAWENPQRDAPKWSEDDGLMFKRKGNPKESTLEAHGMIEGLPTGRHFDIRVYDDVIDEKSVTNPDMIRKVTDTWALSLSLGKEGGLSRYIGTRYHHNDPYREIMARGAAKPRIYACTKEGTWPGTPIMMSLEELTKRRREQGIFTFAAQMLQDPSADKAMGFKADWLMYFLPKAEAKGMNTYIIGDPANEKKKESDYTAIGVIGLGPDENYYLLDGVRDRLSLKERADALFSLHRRWRPMRVGWEKYGMQADIDYFKIRMGDENYRFDIVPLGGQIAKHDRIRRLIPIFEAGRMLLPETLLKTDYEGRVIDLIQSFIEEEYKPFPVGLHEDFFDMMARIMDEDLNAVWPKLILEEDRYSRPRKRRRGNSSSWAA